MEEELNTCISKTQQLLSEAESLLKDIEEMLDWFPKKIPSSNALEGQADVEEVPEISIIDNFCFVNAATEEALMEQN